MATLWHICYNSPSCTCGRQNELITEFFLADSRRRRSALIPLIRGGTHVELYLPSEDQMFPEVFSFSGVWRFCSPSAILTSLSEENLDSWCSALSKPPASYALHGNHGNYSLLGIFNIPLLVRVMKEGCPRCRQVSPKGPQMDQSFNSIHLTIRWAVNL